MASPGLAVPEEPHQPLSFRFSKAAIWANYFTPNQRVWVGECKSNLTTQVLVAPALCYHER